jgi:hypothetical protein
VNREGERLRCISEEATRPVDYWGGASATSSSSSPQREWGGGVGGQAGPRRAEEQDSIEASVAAALNNLGELSHAAERNLGKLLRSDTKRYFSASLD